MSHSLLLSFIRSRRALSSKGFTLAELLVVIFIAGAIISGLMYLAVELLTTDNREATRTETQRDLQLAMDFMSSELREAIFVYSDVIDPDTNALFTFFPTNDPDFGNPVLAFWKQQRLPIEVRERCAVEDLEANPTLRQTCLRGYSYTLVVYSLGGVAAGNNNDSWRGRAQIVRSAMNQFDSNDGDVNNGYISPVTNASVAFDTWPPAGQTPAFNQTNVLTDFIDDGTSVDRARSGECPEAPGVDPIYGVSPSQPVNGSIRSFYACVSLPGTTANGTPLSAASQNQEVIIYLQGNAAGRSGLFRENSFLPTLETRVLSRGILDKNF
ncbi:MAG: prepilin-type N-terminal cleavage/methylation domain-containing protein [Cyanobacteria bacterium P01_E01_bin.6]